ncbi:NAD+ synthase [Methanococcoides alaskense]|uniref:NH(3)-dependent NAD(+) synthetase n=1 Tax=Methanococcoides alaskense TaxID=325778 RepID=A0AA90Z738_9EURY|nr:NAD+ synthase [Methanococcoides alaskense]MDA0524556.1 NAD+ synthase [Methanococcoides alaskense]MDR6222244.1 NAD+ synthase [Methanococcoides alaskense]
MDIIKAKDIIIDFIGKKLEGTGIEGAVVGISGGIDSALVAYLSVEALGAENVLGIHMPEASTPESEIEDAKKVAEALGIDLKVVDITSVLEGYRSAMPDIEDTSAYVDGNLKARIRMSMLYYYANMLGRVVMGTGNKSEILLGYFTKYGDGGVDMEPIGDLYKTEVWKMSKILGVQESILEKAPSAGLWEGQTDEEDLGVSYETIDKVLQPILAGEGRERVHLKLGVPMEDINSILLRVRSNLHKRATPPIAHLDDLRDDWLS